MSAQTTRRFKVITCSGGRTISAVAFTADGHIFAGDEGGEIRRWKIEDAQQIGPTMKANGSIASAVVSNDGRWLATGDGDRKGIIWSVQDHEKVLEVTEHTRSVYAVDISGDLTRFATGSCDKTARIFSATSGVRLIPPLQHDRAVVGLRFSPRGDRLVTATYDTCIRIYSCYTGEQQFEISIGVMHTPTTPFAWSPDGKDLFVVSPGKITCINTPTHSSVEWAIHNSTTRASIMSNGRFIACSAGFSVTFWDVASQEQIGSIIEHAEGILCITLSAHDEWFACGHGKSISVYSVGEILHNLHPHAPASRALSAIHRPHLSIISRPVIKNKGDINIAFVRAKLDEVVTPCSPAMPPDHIISVDLLVKRSEARATMRLWEDALEDANMVVQTDASCHYAYERQYVALHGMGRYDEAIRAFDAMLSLIERSEDPEIRGLRGKYVSTSEKQMAINDIVHKTFKHGPLVLIDVTTGRLCDRQVLPDLFQLDPTFKELLSAMSSEIDKERIRSVVSKYFGFVMFSHVWGDGINEERKNEPSLKVVKDSGSVYHLLDSPMNNKLRNFCAKVTELGYRWAWSDTCCIDKSDDAVLNRSIRSMYKWYEASDATLVFLGDVSCKQGNLIRSLWMTRAWTLQEAFAPKRILFYDRDWKLYRGITSDNHKKSAVILEELASATGVPPETLMSFHPESLGVREKLRLASTRTATLEEDAAYSLIGIFKSDVTPRYGEGEDALGHLLEGVVAHLGEVTILAWTGSRSVYHSCLPSTLAVYSQPPHTPPTLGVADMRLRTAQLSTILSKDDAMDIYYRITRLPPARFANRRLQLPCLVFRVKRLTTKDQDNDENRYRAKASGLSTVEFTTADTLPLAEPQRLVIVHPWIRDIRGPHPHVEGARYGSNSNGEVDSDSDGDIESDESWGAPASGGLAPNSVDDHMLALRMIVRLQQPFNALLLLRKPGDLEYKRVAAENKIIAQLSRNYTRPKDIRAEVVDVL